jgi:hypothetical protein
MANLSSLIELYNRHEARSIKWKKNGIFYSSIVDGILLEINMAVPSCRINKGEWHKLWSGTRASIKAQAIRLTSRAVDASPTSAVESESNNGSRN